MYTLYTSECDIPVLGILLLLDGTGTSTAKICSQKSTKTSTGKIWSRKKGNDTAKISPKKKYWNRQWKNLVTEKSIATGKIWYCQREIPWTGTGAFPGIFQLLSGTGIGTGKFGPGKNIGITDYLLNRKNCPGKKYWKRKKIQVPSHSGIHVDP